MKIVEKILHIILDIFIVIIALLAIVLAYNFIQIKAMGKDYANFFGYTLLEISTGSMRDTLEEYDVVLVKLDTDIEVNDIITYKSDKELITHRIKAINGNEIIAKGDANSAEDKTTTRDSVIGKVVKTFPHLGIWFKVFTEPKVLASIFVTLILIGSILSHGKDKKEQNNNENQTEQNEIKEPKTKKEKKPKKEKIKKEKVKKEKNPKEKRRHKRHKMFREGENIEQK